MPSVRPSVSPAIRPSRSSTRALFHFIFFSEPLPFLSLTDVLPLPVSERTKARPLARGDITPRQAIAFLAPQLTAGLAVLTQLNWYRCVPA
jgi:hypothetical protein